MFPKSGTVYDENKTPRGSAVSKIGLGGPPLGAPRAKAKQSDFFAVLSEKNGSGVRPTKLLSSGNTNLRERGLTIQELSKPLGFKGRMEATLKWLRESVNSES
jgi:hypothetical protein